MQNFPMDMVRTLLYDRKYYNVPLPVNVLPVAQH